MGIADDIVRTVIGCRLKQDVYDIQSTVDSFYMMSNNNSKRINSGLLNFIPTDNILELIDDFKLKSNDFVLQFDKSYSDGSNILGGINNLFQSVNCLLESDVLKLNLGPLDQLNDLSKLPREFMDWIGLSALSGILNTILDKFPHPEFRIGLDIGAILNNALGFDIFNLLNRLMYYTECISLIGIDVNPIQQKVYGTLDKLYLTPTGQVNFSKIASRIPSESVENIKDIIRGTQIILNNSMNSMARVFDNFQVVPFILEVGAC